MKPHIRICVHLRHQRASAFSAFFPYKNVFAHNRRFTHPMIGASQFGCAQSPRPDRPG
jgi:hypothetical protein